MQILTMNNDNIIEAKHMNTTIVNIICPYCKCEIDSVSHLQSDKLPEDGCLSICVNCHYISVFTMVIDDLLLRKPSLEEIDIIKNNRFIQNKIIIEKDCIKMNMSVSDMDQLYQEYLRIMNL